MYHWFALRSVPLVGNVLYRRLLDRFGSPEAVFRASDAELASVRGVSSAVAASIRGHDPRAFAESECERVRRAGVRIVTIRDPDYPPLLLQIADPPPYLYVKGDPTGLEPAVAVVGSRRATVYGRTVTARLAEDLARRGVAVVSGMARGIDTAAHQGALAGEGRTVGVLGCGIDVVYPPENRALFARVADRGALVSEFPLGMGPLAENFPRRNRIISGMCRGVLVVEAAERSGSLITAQMALDQGRDVFAIPGNITSSGSSGTNRLIREGAKLVAGVEDILEELVPRAAAAVAVAPPLPPLPAGEAALMAMFGADPLHIDEIIAKSALTVGEVSAMLLRLELKGVVTQLPGKFFHAN
ncbi:DNA-processing protein DprA [Geobacter sulfurreducens]|jgi:DNA processing protein|uniref:DNA protection single-strand-binding protein DprA n=1 Tax=Geobacter sulfurreducens (strain ATCC 51573 / DSM 12127 / PCA) TaxID=243231 RepID=Q74A41_GEOSL|nr:DNA-processing protein DprA [Geobacter sulfurreducens]AAR35923.1 DNA protection single-strand-binding protein DprA [Geobacter sulfurreducens PCA]ADI85308.1 DNA protection single-strand-binding protein DprA [Geobacter sulfurreducens KN400]AJY68839.1 DNA polymerase [Geobacter sulfurreducens]QVW34375.1 DNA-processing protein DprA [Geobacter sulfurreducens]UAC03246.1 DNA-processing protein DprA [Geobacter sulfurreducens]